MSDSKQSNGCQGEPDAPAVENRGDAKETPVDSAGPPASPSREEREWTAYAKMCSGRMAQLYYDRLADQQRRRCARDAAKAEQQRAKEEAQRARARASLARNGDLVQQNIDALHEMQNAKFIRPIPQRKAALAQSTAAAPTTREQPLPPPPAAEFTSRAERLAAIEREFALLTPKEQATVLHAMADMGLVHCLPPTTTTTERDET